jgi:membrane protease YdiL (CAAX protease family)
MSAMAKAPGRFRAALLIGWLLLGVAGVAYAKARNIPGWAAIPVLAAFLVEYPFYLVPAFAVVREKLTGHRLPVFLAASAIFPYLLVSIAAGSFSWLGLARLVALALDLSLWYLVLPAIPLVDLAFLAQIACVILSRYFDGIYPTPFRGVQTAILGHLALIHISVTVLLVQRRVQDGGYGFLPTVRDWTSGIKNYLFFVVIGFPLALWLGAIRFAPPAPLWKTAGIFLGILWVVALSEEFFFRGVLMEWIEEWSYSQAIALVITSLLFGAVHLWFRGFPNWRWALVAGTLGAFCGRARLQAGSIRAGMVTHALVVASWRAFFA